MTQVCLNEGPCLPLEPEEHPSPSLPTPESQHQPLPGASRLPPSSWSQLPCWRGRGEWVPGAGEGRRPPPEWDPTLAPFPGTDLQEVTASSRDQRELLWAWQGWRDAMGHQLRSTFERYVQLRGSTVKPLPRPTPTSQPSRGPTRYCVGLRAMLGRAKQSLQRGRVVVGPGDGNPEPCRWGRPGGSLIVWFHKR